MNTQGNTFWVTAKLTAKSCSRVGILPSGPFFLGTPAVLMIRSQPWRTSLTFATDHHCVTLCNGVALCRIARITKFLFEKILDEIEVRTRKAGAEVVNLLGVGSAFVSPAWSALEMAESIIYDKKKILASCVLLEGLWLLCPFQFNPIEGPGLWKLYG